MVKIPRATPESLVRSLRRRRRQRGASVMIVFLVMAMLTGIGMFAARSSTLSTTVAGSSKQLAQTRYMTEYAIINAAAALARDPERYVKQMPVYAPVSGDLKCYGFASVQNSTCYPMSYKQLEDEAGVALIPKADIPNKVPGALGLTNVDADFNIDITDLAPASPPVAGETLNPDSPVKIGYLSLTLTATGQIRPLSTNANMAQNLAASASVQTWRAHVVVGPMSNPPARPPAM